MRSSAVPDGVIGSLLQVNGTTPGDGTVINDRIRQVLDRSEKPFRGQAASRDGKARQAFAYAGRKMQEATSRSTATDVWDDPRVLIAGIRWLHAMGDVWRAEADAGDFTAWLPHPVRADPFGELDREITRWRERAAELLRAEVAHLDREIEQVRADARRAAEARLVDRRGRAMTTVEYEALSEAEQNRLASAWVDGTAELRKYGAGFDPNIGETPRDVARKRHGRGARSDDW